MKIFCFYWGVSKNVLAKVLTLLLKNVLAKIYTPVKKGEKKDEEQLILNVNPLPRMERSTNNIGFIGRSGKMVKLLLKSLVIFPSG